MIRKQNLTPHPLFKPSEASMLDSENQKESTFHIGLQIEDLAQLNPNTIVDRERLANIFQVSPRTVRRMVQRGELPCPASMGRKKYWLVGNVLGHLAKQLTVAENKSQRERKRLAVYTTG